jgi:Tfp pilus assembly protein PilV
MPGRLGYTLVEIVVAMLVFTIGGLALAAGSAVIGRTMAVNNRRETATRLATSRLEQIRSNCENGTSGADSIGSIHLNWNVASSASSINAVATVTYLGPSGVRNETFRASFSCQ